MIDEEWLQWMVEIICTSVSVISSVLTITTALLANRKIRKQSTQIQELNEVLDEWESPVTHVEIWRKVNVNGGPVKYVDTVLKGVSQ